MFLGPVKWLVIVIWLGWTFSAYPAISHLEKKKNAADYVKIPSKHRDIMLEIYGIALAQQESGNSLELGKWIY